MAGNRYSYSYVSRLIDRYMDDLPKSTERLARFILDRTYAFKDKDHEYIPMRHFLNGISGVRGPVYMDERTVRRGLLDLEERGLIIVSGRRGFTRRYALNIGKWEEKQYTPTDRNVRINVSGADTNVHPNNNHKELSINLFPFSKEKKKRVPAALEDGMIIKNGIDAGSEVMQALNTSVRKTTAARDERLSKGQLSALYIKYQLRVRDQYDFTPRPLFLAQLAIFKRTFMTGIEGWSADEFMCLVVDNWTAIMTDVFHWVRSPPNHPELMFICRHVHRFLDAASAIKSGEPLRKKSFREQKLEKIKGSEAFVLHKQVHELQGEIHYLQNQLRVQPSQTFAKIKPPPVRLMRTVNHPDEGADE